MSQALTSAQQLLAELSANKGDLAITTLNDDLNNFHLHCPDKAELIVCMGDTLPDLESKDEVTGLFVKIYHHLEKDGEFVLTYRDLSFELKDIDRFLPVKSDETRIFTCFLEYEEEKVKIHDLLYVKENNEWTLYKSFYQKLRLPIDWVADELNARLAVAPTATTSTSSTFYTFLYQSVLIEITEEMLVYRIRGTFMCE